MQSGGGIARVAGGAVRNAILKEPISDIDIATDVLPQLAMRLCKDRGFSVHPTGIDHGTITIAKNCRSFEVTTLRLDIETDGRHAVVSFTKDWAEDAARRDFTMNAMYCDLAGNIYDYTAGYDDCVNRRVKFVGSPAARIAEDHLRILRFFRFHARYGKAAPDAAGLKAVVRARKNLSKLSAERIRQELLKLIVAPRAVPTLKLMAKHKVLPEIVPINDCWKVLQRLPEDAILRLAVLAKSPENLQATLKLSNNDAERIAQLTTAPNLTPDLRGNERRRILYQLGAAQWHDAVTLNWARSSASMNDRAWRSLLNLSKRWAVPKLPVNGRDLQHTGLAQGKVIGQKLQELEDWWIAKDFKPDRAELLEYLKGLS